ncbi:MAG: Hsp20/alpha crystallin family protein [Candidatus Marinimicrobia bacterium]|nr:Hsp20/alpha crystallin family protein [Candidatus Neomarinimicrobiota bacterium]
MALVKVSRPRMPNLVDDMFRSFFDEPMHSNSSTWRPAMDAKELETSYEIKFSMPGFKKDQIQVSFSNNTLSVKGEQTEEKEEKEEKGDYLYREIAYGRYERSLYLPENVDPNKVDASFTDGILSISIAKKEEALPKEIAVKVK